MGDRSRDPVWRGRELLLGGDELSRGPLRHLRARWDCERNRRHAVRRKRRVAIRLAGSCPGLAGGSDRAVRLVRAAAWPRSDRSQGSQESVGQHKRAAAGAQLFGDDVRVCNPHQHRFDRSPRKGPARSRGRREWISADGHLASRIYACVRHDRVLGPFARPRRG